MPKGWNYLGHRLGPISWLLWDTTALFEYLSFEDMEYEIRSDREGYFMVAAENVNVGLVTYYEVNADGDLSEEEAVELIYQAIYQDSEQS